MRFWRKATVVVVLGSCAWAGLWVAGAASSVPRQARRASSFSAVMPTLGEIPGEIPGESSPDRIVQVTFPLQIKVGLMVGKDSISVSGRGAFRVRCGSDTFEAAAGETWKALRIDGAAARVDWLVVVATFDWRQEAAARELAKKWSGQGFDSGVLPAGVEMVSDSGPVHDNRRHYVTVGRFDDPAPARELMKRLVEMGESPWLHERLLGGPAGTVAVIDPAGRERARGDGVAFESEAPLKVFRVHHDVGFPQEGFEDREYEGRILAALDKDGKLAAVNQLELDNYLQGVVPSEVFASDPMETLRSQAVAARGETLAHLGLSAASQPFDICSDQNCQMYTGLKAQTPNTTQAVRSTRGEVLKHGENIVQTFFAAACGGHSESVENVWNSSPHPSLVGVPDAPAGQSTFPSPLTEASLAAWLATHAPCYCRGEGNSTQYRWTVTFTQAQLDAHLNKLHPVGTVRQLVPLARGVSGRIRSLKVVGSKDTFTIVKELAIRRALGNLKSSLFVATKREEDGDRATWTLKGAGHGHGVGLCQVGARFAAKMGLKHHQILAHYYRSAAVTKIY